jgi:two-component system, chemotaxis family, protein-glutamate methylesterase/glutaminase
LISDPGLAGTSAPPARVLVCDDSSVIRSAIARVLESDPAIRVVARAGNGRQALEELRRTTVDVVVLDIEMPLMDGLAALPLLLREHPGLRVVMASTLTTRGAEVTLQALSLGAADYVPKPSAMAALAKDSFRRELVEKVKGLSRSARRAPRAPLQTSWARPARPPQLLAVGSSTGGPQALLTLVRGLGSRLPVPLVVTQHMPPTFTRVLAEHIGRAGALPCAEAEDGAPLRAGSIAVAPGGRHLIIERGQAGLRARLSDGPPVNYCRPSVDPMLESAAQACDGRVLVTMLTGMGHDGLEGTRRVVKAGGTALAQDEATSVVWGMPGAVAQAGLCHAVLPLPDIAPALLDLLMAVPS